MAFTYRQEWPHADAVRFAVNYLRLFATDPAERNPRPPKRPRGRTVQALPAEGAAQFTDKGLEVRSRIVDVAAKLMFEQSVAATRPRSLDGPRGVHGLQLSP